MDKRWIYILIISIVGLGCLYLIADVSTTVGTANVNINSFTVTLPDSYNIEDNSNGFLDIINRKTQEKMTIADVGKGDYRTSLINETYNELKYNESYPIVKNQNIKINNKSYMSIYYENGSDINQIVFVKKFDHTIVIGCEDFKDNSTMSYNIKYIMDSIRPDYKQKQD